MIENGLLVMRRPLNIIVVTITISPFIFQYFESAIRRQMRVFNNVAYSPILAINKSY